MLDKNIDKLILYRLTAFMRIQFNLHLNA